MTASTSFNRTFDPPISPAELPDRLLEIASTCEGLLNGPKQWNGRPIGTLQVVISEPRLSEETDTIPDLKQLGRKTLEFGKHAGEQFSQIPLPYLEWLHDSTAATLRKLKEYLEHPAVRRERAIIDVN